MIFCANRLYLTKNGYTAYKKKKKKKATSNCLTRYFEFLTPPIAKKPKTKTMGIIIINEKLCSHFNTARSILIKTFTTVEKRSGLG